MQLNQDIHVWLADPEHFRSPHSHDSCRSLLSAEEITSCERFHFAEDRHHYLVSHAMLRYVLSGYAAISPAELSFCKTDRGKPLIANPGLEQLKFNLTHTRGFAACVVTEGLDCGIDVEQLAERHKQDAIARRMFSATNCAVLEQVSENDYQRYFYTQWTLREAFVKATGAGLSFPTEKLTFKTDNLPDVELDSDEDLPECQHDWQIQIFNPTSSHIGALAVKLEDHTRKTVRFHNFDKLI